MECNKICEEIGKMLIAMSEYKITLGLLLGWLLAILVGNRFADFTRRIQDNLTEDIKSLQNPLLKEKWDRVVNIGNRLTDPNRWLGKFETTLFYACLFINKPEGIAAWLGFKVAVKWESWANIVRVPDRIKLGKTEIDNFEYLELRNKLAAVVSQKFLIGTIGNILAAGVGMALFCIIKYWSK